MSKHTTLWTTEAQIELKLLTYQCVIDDGNWNDQLKCFLGLDFSFNWQVNDMNWHSFNINTFVHSEEDTLLPTPVSIILNFDFSQDNSAWETFKQLRLTNKQCSLLFMATLASVFSVSKTPLVFTLVTIFFHLFHKIFDGIFVLLIATQFINEASDHFLKEFATMMSVMMTMTVSVTSFLFGLIFLLTVLVFVQNSDHNSWSTVRFPNLKEGVIMSKIVFTLGAVVKVLTNSTLVPKAENWINSTAITLDSSVFDKWFF